jgi:diguanylate cyclase (GGDEF)-like protein/PAS domain S-box-containing protein
MAFAVLIAMLVGIGEAGLRRMKEIEENLGDITGRRSDKLQLSREALALSNRNSRITMEIFLLQDRAQTNVLLATRAENTKKISALMAEISRRCESAEEKQRLSAVEATRKPYIDSYLRALHLLVDERKHDDAERVMISETLPALHMYHAAWDEFVDFQKNQVSVATKQAEVDYAKTRRLAYLLIVLAVAVALAVALFTTRQTACEIAMRIDAQKEVSKLNGTLEEKVMQRTNELRVAEEKYRAIFEDAVVGIFRSTPDGRYIDVNPSMARMLGYDSPHKLIASITDISRQVYVDPDRRQELKRLLREQATVTNFEYEVLRKDGSKVWFSANVRALSEDGVLVGYEGTNEDITSRKVAEERVQYLAFYDALTGLPNRRLLQDRLAKALASARRRKDKVAILFLDLDRFKHINDSLGHAVGDLFLQEVAVRLKTWAREQDTVARVGGDEFLIVLTAIREVGDAAVAAERLMDAMAAEFVVQGHSFSVTCSLGISIFPEHGVDGETLIKNADAAMYSAKDIGRDNFQFFAADMNAQAVERLALENGLRLALEKKELFLVYQPQMDINTGKITGLEALLRWQHPELGLVPPDRFIRIAENSGLIMPIGEWVLRTACSQARKWQDEGIPAVSVAVNVSAVQFRQEGFCQLIRRVLDETGLAPQHLELELTESLLLANADVTFSVLQELTDMGVTLAIDDFGTGYSNFSYLRQFRVSKLKIDRSFITNVAANPDDAAITAAMISMAKSLHLKVIAEGVEDEAQMSFLRAHQCDEIQGYYFSKPLAVDKVADKLRGDHPAGKALAQASGKQA